MTSCKAVVQVLKHETSIVLLIASFLVMKLSTFNSLLVVRVERGVRWLS